VSGKFDITICHSQSEEVPAHSGDVGRKLFGVRQGTPHYGSFAEIHEILSDAEIFLNIKTTPKTNQI
jgi:hypothetical protein